MQSCTRFDRRVIRWIACPSVGIKLNSKTIWTCEAIHTSWIVISAQSLVIRIVEQTNKGVGFTLAVGQTVVG